MLIILLAGCGGGTSSSSTRPADTNTAKNRHFAADEKAIHTLSHDLDDWLEARAVWGRQFRPGSLRVSRMTARPDLQRVQAAFAALRDDAGPLRDRSVRDVAGQLIGRCGQETDVIRRLTRTILSGQDAQAELVRFGRVTVVRANTKLRFEAAVQRAYGAKVLP